MYNVPLFERGRNLLMLKFLTKKLLRDGESNPGLPRDRRGYSPLYYRGFVNLCYINDLFKHCNMVMLYPTPSNVRPTF